MYVKKLWEWLDEEICILGKVCFFYWSEIFWPNKYEILSEMGPYGSVGAHIKTGRSPMAQIHFKTPPDPKKGHEMTKKSAKK